MPFVRVSRDKRGYEHIYLVHAATRRGKPSRPSILYWFRTPPGVIVGREPFDQSVRRALEAQNPDVTFDWDKLVKMTVSPPDEPWRERRRGERAAKQARLAADQPSPRLRRSAEASATAEAPATAEASATAEVPEGREGGGPGDTSEAAASPVPERPRDAEFNGSEDGDREDSETRSAGGGREPAEGGAIAAAPSGTDIQQPNQRRRRRRRGGRRRRSSSGSEPTSTKMPPNSSKGEKPIG